jgi:hypothetical protein
MDLRDDSTNTTISITPTAQKVGNYIELSNVFNLKEGRFYDLKVIDTNTANIIYKDIQSIKTNTSQRAVITIL